MIRVAICQFGEETNCFVNGRATLRDLCPPTGRWCLSSEVEEVHRNTQTYIGGALDAIRDLGCKAVPLDFPKMNGANFLAGPIMTRECVIDAVGRICDELRRRRDEYDCLFLSMHGAAVSELTEDVETYTLSEVRKVVGDLKIMGSLDNHGNLTDEMVRLSDGYIGTKTVPHTDIYEAGYRAASMLIRTVRGEIDPKMALRRLPLLSFWPAGTTLDGIPKEIREYLADYVQRHGLLDATFFQGFSSADCACTGASVLVVADGYVPDKEAEELAFYVWERREGYRAESCTAAEAIDKALAMVKDRFVVLFEGSDNPGSGCPGDGTHLLREFVTRNLPRTIMGPIYDPQAAAICHTHKIGDRFPIQVGGNTQPEIFGAPLEFKEAELLGLADGKYISTSPVNLGLQMDFGPTARLRAGNVEFIVVSACFQTFDNNAFLMTGCDMKNYDIVGLKSAQHFKAYFGSRMDGSIAANTPGLRPAGGSGLNFKHVPRPIFPLDDDAVYDGHWPK